MGQHKLLVRSHKHERALRSCCLGSKWCREHLSAGHVVRLGAADLQVLRVMVLLAHIASGKFGRRIPFVSRCVCVLLRRASALAARLSLRAVCACCFGVFLLIWMWVAK